MKKIKNIIFDLDGTLIDSLPDIHASVSYMLKEYKIDPVDIKFLGEHVGHGAKYLIDNTMQHVIDKTNPDTYDVENFKNNFFANYLKYYEAYASSNGTLYEGVTDGLIKLHKEGYKMFIVTNKPQAVTDAVLKYLDIEKYFVSIIGDGKFEYRKPHVELWNILSKDYSLESDETIVFGDGTPDFEFAENSACHCAIALYGITAREILLALDAKKYVETFSEFVDYIEH